MKTSLSPLVLMALVALGASAQQPDTPRVNRASTKNVTEIRLKPASAEIGPGLAVMSPVKGKTSVRIRLTRLPDSVTVPIHLNAILYAGSCANKIEASKVMINRNELASSDGHPQDIGAGAGPVTVSGVLPQSLGALRASPFAISVRLTPADGDKEILCGEFLG